jgi:hypothetical protein
MYKLTETASGGGKQAKHEFPSGSVNLKRDRGLSSNYEVVSESSWAVIVVTALVKEDERGSQGHTPESLLHQSAT